MAKKLQNVAKPGYLYYIRVAEETIFNNLPPRVKKTNVEYS